MSSTLVTFVSVAGIVTFMVFAQVSRIRGVARRGETLARSRGLAHYVAYFFFVPYVVIAARPGPDSHRVTACAASTASAISFR